MEVQDIISARFRIWVNNIPTRMLPIQWGDHMAGNTNIEDICQTHAPQMTEEKVLQVKWLSPNESKQSLKQIHIRQCMQRCLTYMSQFLEECKTNIYFLPSANSNMCWYFKKHKLHSLQSTAKCSVQRNTIAVNGGNNYQKGALMDDWTINLKKKSIHTSPG